MIYTPCLVFAIIEPFEFLLAWSCTYNYLATSLRVPSPVHPGWNAKYFLTGVFSFIVKPQATNYLPGAMIRTFLLCLGLVY